MPERLMYLRDNAQVFADPDTGRLVVPKFNEVVGISGLRRQILVRDGDRLVETFEQQPLTPELAARFGIHHLPSNSWNYDYPHYPTEARGDVMRERMRQRLQADLDRIPLNIRIVGLQRRYLMYYSDGNYQTQGRFLRLAAAPTGSPFDINNELLSVYTSGPTLEQVRKEGKFNGGRPLLYSGPAWVVRFTVDGQNPAFGGTRVYVRDDGSFICSDWCQRDPTRADTTIHQQYGKGIDLVSGHSYTLASWILGPCLTRAQAQGVYKPKGAVKTVSIGKLPQYKMPKFAEVLAKHKSAVSHLIDKGLTEEEIVHQIKTEFTNHNRTALHLVPVRLRSDGRYDAKARRHYRNTRIDSRKHNKFHPQFFVLRDYGKPGEPYATVEAIHLEIDEQRLRQTIQSYLKPATIAIKQAGPITPELIQQAITELGKLSPPEPIGIEWEPGPERFTPEGQLAAEFKGLGYQVKD